MNRFLIIATAILGCAYFTGCNSGRNSLSETSDTTKIEGPQIGSPAMGGGQRKAPGPELEALIKETVPYFKQFTYIDEKNDTLTYNLFTPRNLVEGKEYPLVLFMADASTPGPDVTLPLTQGYGGLVWATPEFQSENPCYVLVPQYSYVTVDNQWQTMPEVDQTISLVKEISKKNPIDKNRIYTTGQSMGCMMSLYFNIKYPDLFAASMFVSGQWDVAKMDGFKDKKFIYITAAGDKESTGGADALKALLKKEGASFAETTFSARLPQAEQDSLTVALLSKGDPRNFITFEGNTVLPAGTDPTGRASVHMASFDYAYRLAPACKWLLKQSK